MGRLKPIGSEKLQGDDKVKRIMEIARFGETNKNEDLHIETNHFTKKGADGRIYSIVLERDGYYLKSGINESELDYLSGTMNKKRDRFKSYGSALKRMNLIFKPLNEEYNDGKAISMYEPSEEMEEQEKFVLNVPDEEGGEEDIDMDMGMDTEAGEDDVDMDLDMDMGDEEEDIDVDVEDEGEGDEEEMEGFMKPIQKLTGKLGQKLRDVEEELGSEDIKYVLNSIISAVNLDNLDEEDMDDILDRFDDDETSYGDEEEMDVDIDMDDEDMDLDTEDEVDMDLGMDVDDEEEVAMESIKENIGNGNGQNFGLMGTPTAKYKDLLEKEDIEEDDMEEEVEEMETPAIEDVEEGVAVESLKERVGNLLESYVTKKTKKVKSVKKETKTPQDYLNSRLEKIKESKKIKKNYITIEQELSCEKFLKENNSFKFKRKTETGNIILESKDRKVWILNNGLIK